MRQQPPLAFDPSTKPGQRSIRTDHSMAGHDDRQWIASVRQADRACGAWLADSARQLAIADRLPIRNLAKRVPYLALEVRTFRRKRQFERRALATEILGQLRPHYGKHGIVTLPGVGALPFALVALHPDAAHRAAVAREQQLADRAFEQAERFRHVILPPTFRSRDESPRTRATVATSSRARPPCADDRARAPSATRGHRGETRRHRAARA